MVGIVETGYGFDVDEGPAVVQLQDIISALPHRVSRDIDPRGGGFGGVLSEQVQHDHEGYDGGDQDVSRKYPPATNG